MKTFDETQIKSDSSERTEFIAQSIGKKLKGGEVIELISDLGGGKTTFVRGLARGMGSKDNVASPTFTLSREYSAGKLTLHHFDFYRLSEPGIMAAELTEVAGDPNTVVVVEWSDIVRHVLPDERLTVKFEQTTDEQSRKLTFSCPPELNYLMEEREV